MSLALVFHNRKFWPLFWTQFFGALNDNYFKNALVMLITFQGVSLLGLDTKSLVALSGGIFILPFFLFSAISGQLADKLDRTLLTRIIKWVELAIMFVVSYGFFMHHYELLFVALFLMGVHSTFFGPIKYSMIPDLLPDRQLVVGNAYVEVGTFLAILLGTIGSGIVMAMPDGVHWIVGGLLGFSLLGLATSYFMTPVPRAAPDLKLGWNPIPQLTDTLGAIRGNQAVFNSVLGISWFWFLGAAILSMIPIYVKSVLIGNESIVTLFLTCFTVGVAIGAVACEKLSYERIEIGLVPIGSLGMTIFLLDLGLASRGWTVREGTVLGLSGFFAHPGSWRVILAFLGIAIAGGIYTVPLYTLIQQRSPAALRSRVVAANNILNAVFMVLASGLLIWFYSLDLSVPVIFMVWALINSIVAVYIYSLVPEFTLRFWAWVVARFLYRVRVKGHEHIPSEGPALLVSNHVSYVDWLVIAASIKRPIRFVMHHKFSNVFLLKYLMRQAHVIPIAGEKENGEIFRAAFKHVNESLKAGELVCIFPEGTLTKDGEVAPFKKGLEHILATNPVPVIPLALNGLWGSFFSHRQGRVMRQFSLIPKRIWSRIQLSVGRPVPANAARAEALRGHVLDLMKLQS
jgi:1-acyl-sn-glycerol-3-phosphate acyltransferase